MSDYPKWLYHAEHEARIVRDSDAHKALGPGWVESPALIEKVKAPEAPKAVEPKKPGRPKKIEPKEGVSA